MSEKNKVMFGISNVHFGTYSVADNGTVTLGTPVKVPGTVNMTLEPESEEVVFYADNRKYWTTYSDNGYTGELENALFDEAFKKTFLGYRDFPGGGIAEVKGAQRPKVYMCFQAEGDIDARRAIVYNVTLGKINREHATTEDTTEPGTATLPFTVSGDEGTNITRVEFKPGDDNYDTLFTTPPVPELPDESE